MFRKTLAIVRNPRIVRWFFLDFIDNHGRLFIGFGLLMIAWCARLLGDDRQFIRYLMSAHRVSNGKCRWINQFVFRYKSEILRESLRWINSKKDDGKAIEMAIGRTIILKKTKKVNGVVVEKGVLLITFTDSCGILFKEYDFERIGQDYYIILEPSWAGYCLPELLVWATLSHPVIVEATEPLDYSFMENFSCNFHPISIGASNWVDNGFFYPLEGEERTYDAIYVTNYNRIKRHHVFFKAIAKARKNDRTFRASMACGSVGEDRELVHALIDFYGIRACLDIYEDLGKDELNRLLNRSRCNVLLSLKEGSNRSVFESMFAGLPVIVLSKNIGVRKDYINELTGVLCSDSSLADDFKRVKIDYDEFKPAEWASQNISPEVSTEKLASHIKEIADDSRWGVESNILVKVNRPEVEYKGEVKWDPGLDVRSVLNRFRKQ
jgi:glycosyltransferase involved in cell wall biosynthesis